MKRTFSLSVLMFGVLLCAAASAQAQLAFPATTDEEWEALVASNPQDATFIRTQQDFEAYKSVAVYPGLPLHGLTAQQLADWSTTVWVNNGGLVSMDIGILKSNLSPRNYANVLAAFGIAVQLAEDKKDHECESAGNCKLDYFSICLSTC